MVKFFFSLCDWLCILEMSSCSASESDSDSSEDASFKRAVKFVRRGKSASKKDVLEPATPSVIPQALSKQPSAPPRVHGREEASLYTHLSDADPFSDSDKALAHQLWKAREFARLRRDRLERLEREGVLE